MKISIWKDGSDHRPSESLSSALTNRRSSLRFDGNSKGERMPTRRFILAVIAGLLFRVAICAAENPAADPWTPAQLMSAEAFNKHINESTGAKPLVIYVGFRVLYTSGHIPGAVYYGAASDPDGLAELTKRVEELPRRKEIILYCGCCPWNECPNIRPAFHALKQMGFTRIKAVNMPTNLATDWVGKGYPLEKGN
jgi:thiosulfate/3-mercaptopyruvate sulfurtransferase